MKNQEEIAFFAQLEADNLVDSSDSPSSLVSEVNVPIFDNLIRECFINGVDYAVDNKVIDFYEMSSEIARLYLPGLNNLVTQILIGNDVISEEELLTMHMIYFVEGITWCLTYSKRNNLLE